MKYLFLIIIACISIHTYGQTSDDMVTGNVSYISSQHVYVRFVSTEGIHVGDTLFLVQNNKKQPALIVSSLSSISCVGNPINNITLNVTNPIAARKKVEEKPLEVVAEKSIESISVNDQAIKSATKKDKDTSSKQRFDGRLSISSYSNISTNYPSNNRLRYNLTLNDEHIGNSKLSLESYISFTHKLNDSTEKYKDLKVYNLALKYDISKTAHVILGRKINNYMANVGAVDGLQFENDGKHFSYGAVVGSRPDTYTYYLNPDLLQFGAFIAHNYQSKTGTSQTSLAAFNQMNKFKTDRRFIYLQHSNSLLKNVDLFCSFEMDLYAMKDSLPKNTFDLTSTYVSLRYSPWRQLSMSLSYDARKNIYYYETYKNRIDSTLDKVTRQGFRFQTTIRPFRYFSVGGTAGYRVPTKIKTDTLATTNASGFMSYSNLPFQISTTLTATTFKSGYTNGNVYGISLNRDFFSGKFNLEGEYRKATFNYSNSQLQTIQNIAELSLSWRIAKKLMLSADFETTFDNDKNRDTRIFVNISQRF